MSYVKECTFPHFLNLVWQPILKYIEEIGTPDERGWSSELTIHSEALAQEMLGHVPSPQASMSLHDWIDFIQFTIKDMIRVNVSAQHISAVVSHVAPVSLHTTRANAMHLLRSSLCKKLVGTTLAKQLSLKILALVSDLLVPLSSEQALAHELRQDLVATLEQLHAKPATEEVFEASGRAKRMKRDHQSIKENLAWKTEQVLFAIRNRVPFRRVGDTVVDAQALAECLKDKKASSSSGDMHLADEIVSRWNLWRHMLFLDGALDRHRSDLIMQQRESGIFAGVSLATDESPPSQPRFRGLRFQITVLYLGTFAPLSAWNDSLHPPITRTSMLADIVHCPGKKGLDVSRALEKQLARVGLSLFDVVSCTGDGGGENEGKDGVHAFFENLCPGYVRRRCLPHIAWRTSDMAINASSLDYRSLAAYLVDGVTWSRLRNLAVKTQAAGGLGLFKDGSSPCMQIFGKSPSAIISSRPETDLKFLQLLKGKEHVLHRLALKDLEQRKLSSEVEAAVRNLGDIDQRIRRALLCEILNRCMFLLHWHAKHPRVTASNTSWPDLMGTACASIRDLKITPEAS